METKQHHRTGISWDLETKAKISTSMMVSKEEHPDLWEKLFKANLNRMKIIKTIHDKRNNKTSK